VLAVGPIPPRGRPAREEEAGRRGRQINQLLVGAFTVALFHTAIPSHWLCFVLVGRARGWRLRRTMAVAALAGVLHVAVTVTLGLVIARLGHYFLPLEDLERMGGWVLVGLAALYLLLHFTRQGHHHHHEPSSSDRIALGGLMLAVTISPCSLAIPVLVGAAGTSPMQVLLISAVLLVTTVGNMVMLVGLTGLGVEKLPFHFFDHYEKLILGLVLGAVGAFILLAHEHEGEPGHATVRDAGVLSAPRFPSTTPGTRSGP
jgi:putative Mn2+ efflux pump MntP